MISRSELLITAAALVSTFCAPSRIYADTYKAFSFTSMAGTAFVITNLDTGQSYVTEDLYGKISDSVSGITGIANQELGGVLITPNSGQQPGLKVYNVSGNTINFKSESAIVNGMVDWQGQPRFVSYGVDFDYNVETGEISNVSLTGYEYSQGAGSEEIAEALGYEVKTVFAEAPVDAYEFQSYTENFLNQESNTNGGLVSPQLTAQDGTSIVRQESDGTVHLGENSLVFAERGAAGFTEDTIFSSNGILQIGDGPTHSTVFQGTVEVPDPTAPNHAANKRYVDSSMAMSLAMSSLPSATSDRVMLGLGTGYLGGETAFALGLSKGAGASGFSFNANVGYSRTTDVGAAFGVGVEF